MIHSELENLGWIFYWDSIDIIPGKGEGIIHTSK